MKRTDTDAVLYPGCPIRNILSRFCDKWSLLVLHMLHCSGEAPLRFKELQRRIPDISQKMLTVTLRTLEEDGYVKRTVYAEVPPRVEYRLTERAESLYPCLSALCDWAVENFEAIMRERGKAAE